MKLLIGGEVAFMLPALCRYSGDIGAKIDLPATHMAHELAFAAFKFATLASSQSICAW